MKRFLLLTTMVSAIYIQAPAQNVGIGVADPLLKLHVNGNLMIDSAYFLEFGGRVTKEINAGKIGYQIFTPGTLDMVGAGTAFLNRKIKFWNEGGATFAGKIHLVTGELTHQATGEFNNLLPVGIAFVTATGAKQYGTSNITTSLSGDHFVVDMGTTIAGMQAVVTVNSNIARTSTILSASLTAFWVYIWTLTGVAVQHGFHFVAFKP